MPSLRQVGHCSLASLLQPAVSHTLRVSTAAAMLPGGHGGGAAARSCRRLGRAGRAGRREGGTDGRGEGGGSGGSEPQPRRL